MTRPRLALLDASFSDANTPRNFRRELDADLVEFDVTDGDAPDGDAPDGFGFDGFVVTGSAVSVYWDEDWLDPVKTWVNAAIERGLPALGVCFGHQLLADVLGGTVAAMDEYEIGYRTVERTGSSTLLAGLDDAFVTFTTHQDAVIDLPPDATVTASNEYGVHGFECGCVFGVQFHPEYDETTARAITESKRDRLTTDEIDAALDTITTENVSRAQHAKRLFEAFVAFVEAERPAVQA